jgi:hypothetical protein
VIHPGWLLVSGLATVVMVAVAFSREPPVLAPAPARTQTNTSAAPTPSPAQTWRPAVKVDWRKHPAGLQKRIDTHGQRRDCDQLANHIDAAWGKDRALADYTEAWRERTRLCIDAYYDKRKRAP